MRYQRIKQYFWFGLSALFGLSGLIVFCDTVAHMGVNGWDMPIQPLLLSGVAWLLASGMVIHARSLTAVTPLRPMSHTASEVDVPSILLLCPADSCDSHYSLIMHIKGSNGNESLTICGNPRCTSGYSITGWSADQGTRINLDECNNSYTVVIGRNADHKRVSNTDG